jgi:hypothetical protein
VRKAVLFRIDDEIDVALAVQIHILRAMSRHRRQAHALEQPAQQFRIRCGVFDEFESVGPHGIGRAQLGIHDDTAALLRALMAVPNT